MCSSKKASFVRSVAIVMALTVVPVPTVVFAQGAAEKCLAEGYRPGTAGFFHCIETTESSRDSGLEINGNGDAASILRGSPDDAVTDYSGSSMEGATTPDPEILKQLNTGNAPRR